MGNKTYRLIGASNHTANERQNEDLYCTHPQAVGELLKIEQLSPRVWEPCDGLGHISDCLTRHGYDVRRSDLYTRGRNIERLDFLMCDEEWEGDIVTNPPYSQATEFVRHAIQITKVGNKIAMWLRILFLESAKRKKLFEQYPPIRVWISSRRIPCGKEGTFGASAQVYAWFIWEVGYNGPTTLKWF